MKAGKLCADIVWIEREKREKLKEMKRK